MWKLQERCIIVRGEICRNYRRDVLKLNVATVVVVVVVVIISKIL